MRSVVIRIRRILSMLSAQISLAESLDLLRLVAAIRGTTLVIIFALGLVIA